jgi:transposase InsO family protein
MQRKMCVNHLLEVGLTRSVTRACGVLGLSRSSYYRRREQSVQSAHKEEIILRVSNENPTLGAAKVTALVRGEGGVLVNHKRVERVRKAHGVRASRRGKKRRRLEREKTERRQAAHRDEVWSYDFIEDATTDGCKVRLLSVIDEHSRECVALEAERNFPAARVIDTLERLLVTTGRRPEHLRSDNGPEFVAKAVASWLQSASIQTAYIQPGAPWENGHVESFHASLRAELLDRELFYHLGEVKALAEDWRLYYNARRPHGSLGMQAPLQALMAKDNAGPVSPTSSGVSPAENRAEKTLPDAAQQQAPFQTSATLRSSITLPAGQTNTFTVTNTHPED